MAVAAFASAETPAGAPHRAVSRARAVKRFKLALVASPGPVEDVYAAMQGELRALGCDSRVFRVAPEAGRWLRGVSKHPARSLAGEAALAG